MDLGPFDLSASIGTVKELYQPLQPDDIKATENSIELMEWLRSKFSTGYGHMPPLDPLEKSSLEPIRVVQGVVDADVHLTNLRIDGAKDFDIDLAEIRMSIDTVNANITLPQININVDFYIDVILGVVPLKFTGHLESITTGLNVVGVFSSTETMMNGIMTFQVTDDKLQITADNLRIILSDLSIKPDEDNVRTWWEYLKEDIASVINTMLVQEINHAIMHYSTQQIRDFLLAP
ncbi:uncharacterized protein LOC115445090 isoform X2 [Manduca sexta]|nr:uncharacterized protein LOC115445090 isoform X2 [Manduca sexta]XP_030027039.2 uncharacterized protein LOC115445090 isoform X2 [Manduca sexta]XP_037300523.1 uncharacterized protein LOC115445090 isoform X2 [Manduca sexta]